MAVETSRGAISAVSSKAGQQRPRFAIQKHQARSLHYDFRLEIEGVLVSWAIPKGPSKDPKVKRLAMRVPDHPLDYLLFEGPLQEGEYGAGEVIVWDFGDYEVVGPDTREAAAALRNGVMRLVINGTKLRGLWVLFRTRFGDGKRETWLLEKLRDEFVEADYDPESEPKSALSGNVLRARP